MNRVLSWAPHLNQPLKNRSKKKKELGESHSVDQSVGSLTFA